MWVKLCEDTGMRRVALHALRHTCVSLLLAIGIHPRLVMEIVGHRTMNVYGHVHLDSAPHSMGVASPPRCGSTSP
jgi:integrase